MIFKCIIRLSFGFLLFAMTISTSQETIFEWLRYISLPVTHWVWIPKPHHFLYFRTTVIQLYINHHDPEMFLSTFTLKFYRKPFANLGPKRYSFFGFGWDTDEFKKAVRIFVKRFVLPDPLSIYSGQYKFKYKDSVKNRLHLINIWMQICNRYRTDSRFIN